MTLVLVLSALALAVVAVLAFDWRRSSRLKKQLADGTATQVPRKAGRDVTADPAVAQATADAVARGMHGGSPGR
jgi:hypothetical protein